MQHVRRARRTLLLTLTLLSACAAADPSPTGVAMPQPREAPTGVFGGYLMGRFAMSQADAPAAATEFLGALAGQPDDRELLQQAFIASLVAGRPEAVQLARELPESQAAQFLLGQSEVRAGHWEAAEQRFHMLPRQGLTQLLQPLLVAWAQQGDGRTDARTGDAAAVHGGAAVPWRLCAARRADRRPGRAQRRGGEAVSPGADRTGAG
ncbi:MAG: hypothetical protein WDN25_20745 [Acetobacteraceae bacterium]